MKPNTTATTELAWDLAVRDVPAAGVTVARDAGPDELAAVARALGLIACTSLRAHYAIQPMSGGRYRLSGRLHAEVTQACVVTLDPVEGTLEESFEATFWPREAMPVPESGELAMDDAPEPEPIVAGQIAVGRVVFESLAAALEPYPRKPGAVLDWQPPLPTDANATAATNPFAVLANLKTKG
jgi:uncharacterized metal-binding protein YceD (DUF177 family)